MGLAVDSKLITVVRRLKQYDTEGEAWLKTLPMDISMSYSSNGYVDSLYAAKQALFDALFGDLAEDVAWFLY